jgi:hypothetical protein
MMETTVFTPGQQHLLQLMSFVKDEQTLEDFRDVLQAYLAKKIDEGFDEMIEKGEITPETIEQWGKEHMRTPYRQ